MVRLLALSIASMCDNGLRHSFLVRGNGRFKVKKLLNMMRKRSPHIYYLISVLSECKETDTYCLSNAVRNYIYLLLREGEDLCTVARKIIGWCRA